MDGDEAPDLPYQYGNIILRTIERRNRSNGSTNGYSVIGLNET
jgi:hypothetical protein